MNLKNRFFWIAAIVSLILDRLTKYWVVQNFALGQSMPLWPGVFHFTYQTNPGAAFSICSDNEYCRYWLRWLSLAVSLGLIAWAWFGPSFRRWEQAGFGFILGGALGNGIDRFISDCIVKGRLVSGCVVDFLDFQLIHFAVFNLADVFINVGIVCLLIASFAPTPKD